MTSRKAIFAALFAKVSGLAGLQTVSRRVRAWGDVQPPDQPALFQVEGKQTASPRPGIGLGTVWTFHAELVVYAHVENTVAGADLVDLLNDLVDAVVAALAPLPGLDTQTLGGLVTDVRIDGTIDTSEGRLGDQSVAIIPLVITATA